MSVLVSSLITRCSNRIGDPDNTLTSREEWLEFYNDAHTDAAIELEFLEVDDVFTFEAGNTKYYYPDSMVVLYDLAYNADPVNTPDAYKPLGEVFREEFRDLTAGGRGTRAPEAFLARKNFFELTTTPDATVVDSGRITYVEVPTWVDDETSALMQLPDLMQGFIRDGMVILQKLGGRELASASEDYKFWLAKIEKFRHLADKRSRVRRSSIRPRSHRNWTRGMT